MSSSETEPQKTDGWGIDWRRARTWLEFAGVTLQLTLVAAMASAISVGIAVQMWPLDKWPAYIFALLSAVVLCWLLFRGWAIEFNLPQDGAFIKFRDAGLLESASKTDLVISRFWYFGVLLAGMFLPVGLLEFSGIGAEAWTIWVGCLPAACLAGGGFPYVVKRLRQTATKGP